MNIYDEVFAKYGSEIEKLTLDMIYEHNTQTGFGKSFRKVGIRNKYVQTLKWYFIKEGMEDAQGIAYALSYLQDVIYPRLI